MIVYLIHAQKKFPPLGYYVMDSFFLLRQYFRGQSVKIMTFHISVKNNSYVQFSQFIIRIINLLFCSTSLFDPRKLGKAVRQVESYDLTNSPIYLPFG